MSNTDDASSQRKTDKLPLNLRQKKLNEYLNPQWLRAHNKPNIKSKPTSERNVIDLSDSPRPLSQAEDVASIYRAGDMGGTVDDNIEAFNDLLNYFGSDEAGPSRLGVGKGKDINRYEEMMREGAVLQDDEVLDEGETDGNESEADEDEAEAEEEVLSISPLHYAMEFPSPPHNPYRPEIYENELDLDFGEDYTEDEKADVRKARQIISCAGLASRLSSEEIMYLIEYYNLEGRWLRPRSFMRMHVFNTPGLPVPRMVLSKNLVELGFGSPMHPFLLSVINFFQIAPIQLSPNSYRAILGLYMMYRNNNFEAPTMDEVSHFLQIRRAPNDLGFFYVAFWPKHNKKGFSTGNPSNMKIWKGEYFYMYDVPRVRTQFNLTPHKPAHTVLVGDALSRAKKIADLPKSEKDLDILVTPESLLFHGFYNDGYAQIPEVKFKRNITKKTRKKQIKNLTGKGAMARLPFGRNPFADTAPAPSASAQPRPTASFLARQTIPPLNVEREDKTQNKRKDAVETSKHPPKKNKNNAAEGDAHVESASSFFGSLASENYSENDVQIWKGRTDSDAEFNFKLGLGDAFYHGLTLMNQKNSIIQDRKRTINRYKDDIITLKGQVTEYHTKYHDEVKARRNDATDAQKTLDKQHDEAKKAQEFLEGENLRLQTKVEELEATAKKRKGEAYSLGFLDYLRNFLAADQEYDWSSHFAPSTPAFMSQFKEENSAQIIQARALLDDQIKKELAKLDAEKAGNKGETPPEIQNKSGASPSSQAAK